MKRLSAILLTFILILTMTACHEERTPTTQETEPLESETVFESASASEEEFEKESKTEQKKNGKKKTEDQEDISELHGKIEETVIYDDHDLVITAEKIKYTEDYAKLELLIENNGEKELDICSGGFAGDNSSVNGFSLDEGYLNATVGAGKKSNESVTFDYEKLIPYGLWPITDITMTITLQEEHYKEVDKATVTISTDLKESYPHTDYCFRDCFTSEENQEEYDYEVIYSATDLYEVSDEMSVVSETIIENSYGDEVLYLEVTNDSNEILTAGACDIYINGLLTSGSGIWTSSDVNPGEHGVLYFDMNRYLLEDYEQEATGIEQCGKIALTVIAVDEDNDTLGKSDSIEIVLPGRDTDFSVNGEEIYHDNGIEIKSLGMADDDYEVHFLLFVTNESDETLYISDEYDSISVNGYMCSGLMYSISLSPESSGIISIDIYSSTLEENGIDDIEDIEDMEVTLEVRDENYHDVCNIKVAIEY